MNRSLVICDLNHTYSGNDGKAIQALSGINLTICRGDFVSIVGPSGCGKSTLLSIIAGLISPSSGTVLIEEKSVADAVRHRRLSVVFQDPILLPWRTTTENIRLPLELSGKTDTDSHQVQDQIALVMLDGFENSYPSELSGGMRSRVAIARSLVLSPTLMLMDEPFGALDEMTAHNLNLELLRIVEEKNPTVVLVTHSITQAVFTASRVIVMSSRPGRIIADFIVDLPKPRTTETLSSTEFFELCNSVRNALRGQVLVE